MAKRKPVAVTTKVDDAVSTAFSGIETLAEELREWYDNMPPGPQAGDKGSAVDEAASTLEGISEPTDCPDSVKDLTIEFSTLPLLKNASKADRLSDYLQYAQHVIDRLGEDDVKDLEGVEEYRDEVQNMLDEAEGVEFPGAY